MISRLGFRLSAKQIPRLGPSQAPQPHASTSYLTPRPLGTPVSSIRRASTEAQNLRQDIDDFFAGYSSEPSKPLPLDVLRKRQTHAYSPLATHSFGYLRPVDATAEDVPFDPDEPPAVREVPPFVSAIRIVQRLLTEHGFLNTQDIWKMGTEGSRPKLPTAHVITEDGKIRMKRVSTMREQKRPWVPPPEAPLPDHPFQSVKWVHSDVRLRFGAEISG